MIAYAAHARRAPDMVGCEGCSRAAVSVLAGTTAGAAKERASDATASIAEKIFR